MVLHLLDLLWRFLLSLLCLVFFLDFSQCLGVLRSHCSALSSHSQKSLLAFHFLNSSEFTLSRGSLAPSVSSWTRHSLWSFLTNLSFYTFPSLGSMWPRDARNSRETKYRSLKVNMIWNLDQTPRRNGTLNTRGSTPTDFWWRCAFRISKSWPYFWPKNAIFFTPIFRPGL